MPPPSTAPHIRRRTAAATPHPTQMVIRQYRMRHPWPPAHTHTCALEKLRRVPREPFARLMRREADATSLRLLQTTQRNADQNSAGAKRQLSTRVTMVACVGEGRAGDGTSRQSVQPAKCDTSSPSTDPTTGNPAVACANSAPHQRHNSPSRRAWHRTEVPGPRTTLHVRVHIGPTLEDPMAAG
jgi:hypothetical protein